MDEGTRRELLRASQEAHERLTPWRELGKLVLGRFCKEEIPRIYCDSEVEPDVPL